MSGFGRLALTLVGLTACGGDSTGTPDAAETSPGSAAEAPVDEGGVEVSWLDDADIAASQSIHRMGGTITAPRSAESDLRRIARDALVERARTRGFHRLDDLQIEVGCDDTASAATACTAKVIAVASR